MPKSAMVSADAAAMIRMKPCTIGVSMGVIHGTDTKKKSTGKLKCRSHVFPPAKYRIDNVIAAAAPT